jgi:uncharacterized phage protein (TIGR01671 family)
MLSIRAFFLNQLILKTIQMNREILFRAKKITDNQWVDGGIAIAPDETVIILTKEEQIVWNVIPETVGQFIGVTDKNGKNIFEGDILKTNEANWIGKVEFKHSAYIISDDKGGYSTYPDFMKCEVIGNTHDNPELLITFF